MAALELLLDEPEWQYDSRGKWDLSSARTGRLRVWRDESDRLIALLSIRGDRPDQPGILYDEGCRIPDQIRARFPDRDIEIFAYEHGWWGAGPDYSRAGWAADGTQQWTDVGWRVAGQRLGEVVAFDEDEDTRPGGG